jgi:hypothetical protein
LPFAAQLLSRGQLGGVTISARSPRADIPSFTGSISGAGGAQAGDAPSSSSPSSAGSSSS